MANHEGGLVRLHYVRLGREADRTGVWVLTRCSGRLFPGNHTGRALAACGVAGVIYRFHLSGEGREPGVAGG